MSKTGMSLLLKAVIIVIALMGLITCALWYPFSASLSMVGVVPAPVTQLQKAQLWIQLAFYWAASLPCFVMLVYYWKITDYINEDNAFTFDVARLLQITTKILAVDLIIFFIGNGVFFALDMNDFAFVNFVIAVIGAFVAALTGVLSHFVKEAALLKEESEGTI